jgi:hypothetical protein
MMPALTWEMAKIALIINNLFGKMELEYVPCTLCSHTHFSHEFDFSAKRDRDGE